MKCAYGYQSVPSYVDVKECVGALINYIVCVPFERHERGERDRIGEANPVISEIFSPSDPISDNFFLIKFPNAILS